MRFSSHSSCKESGEKEILSTVNLASVDVRGSTVSVEEHDGGRATKCQEEMDDEDGKRKGYPRMVATMVIHETSLTEEGM